MSCHFLLQGVFLILGSNLHLLHWQAGFWFFFLTTKPPKKPLVNILHAHGSSRYLFEIYLWQLQNWGWEGVRDGSLAARGLEVYVRVREEWGVHLQGSRCHLCPQVTDDAQD